MSSNETKKIIESIIFVSQKPISLKDLKSYFKEYETKGLRKLVNEIIDDWKEADRGFHLVEVSDGYQFRTKPEYAEEIISFNKEIKKFRLSKASLEVLAIAAYKQPLTRL